MATSTHRAPPTLRKNAPKLSPYMIFVLLDFRSSELIFLTFTAHLPFGITKLFSSYDTLLITYYFETQLSISYL